MLAPAWEKNRGRIESDDVDAAHLLCDHDNTGGLGGSSNARDREQLHEASEEVSVGGNGGFLDKNVLLNELSMNVVEVSSCLQGRVAETEQRFEGLRVFPLLHQPAG